MRKQEEQVDVLELIYRGHDQSHREVGLQIEGVFLKYLYKDRVYFCAKCQEKEKRATKPGTEAKKCRKVRRQ